MRKSAKKKAQNHHKPPNKKSSIENENDADYIFNE